VKHGVDWILSDGSATLFVECKTKRLIQAAKVATAVTAIRQEIGILADAVVQLYKNMADALDGKTSWSPDGNPVFPIVLTLEDWYLFSPMIFEILHSGVIEGIQRAGLSIGMVEAMPYTIASVRESERVGPVISEVGVKPFFTCKTSGEHARWMIETVAQVRFADAWHDRRTDLFREDWIRFFPELDEVRA
jgi:hypothetical protein